jgi:maltooligosyltrehalose synthase
VIHLPSGEWYDELGERTWPGGTIPVGELLERFPVALLHLTGGGPT